MTVLTGGWYRVLSSVILNRPLNDAYRYRSAGAALKSYQIFDYAINGTL